MARSQVEAPGPPRRSLDRLPVVRTSARRPVPATNRREAKLPFNRKPDDRLSRRIGQRRLAPMS
jgi:hypothetical protein